MGECSECIYWNGEQYVMNKYGEGCGICMLDGSVRFCSHKCLLCENIDDNLEEKEEKF